MTPAEQVSAPPPPTGDAATAPDEAVEQAWRRWFTNLDVNERAANKRDWEIESHWPSFKAGYRAALTASSVPDRAAIVEECARAIENHSSSVSEADKFDGDEVNFMFSVYQTNLAATVRALAPDAQQEPQ